MAHIGASTVQAWAGKMNRLLILEEDTAFTDANIVDVTHLSTLIQDTRLALPIEANTYANDTAERDFTETNCGNSFANEDPNVAISLGLNSNEVDYATMREKYDGKIVWILAYPKGDGAVQGTRRTDGSIHGFEAQLYFKTSAAETDAKQENGYKLSIKFQDITEWKSKAIKQISYPFSTIANLTPAGYQIELTDSYNLTTGAVTALVTKRAEFTGVEGLVLADFGATDVNVLDTGVTAITEVGDGYYTLVIQKAVGSTPVMLIAGNKFGCFAFNKNGSKYTHKRF